VKLGYTFGMKEKGSFGKDNLGTKKPVSIPNKYKIALQAQKVEDAQNSLENNYDAENADTIAQDMYEAMSVYFHDYNLSKEIRKEGSKTIPVISAGSFEIARYGVDDYRYKDNQGQTAQEQSIEAIVQLMGDSLELNEDQLTIKNSIDQDSIEKQMIDDAEVMAKVVLLFEVPEQIELLPPVDMYNHTQDYQDNEELDYNNDLEDDYTQDGEVKYFDPQGKEYKMEGPLLEMRPKTSNTPSKELSLKTIMVPGVGTIMYNVSKKYFELKTYPDTTKTKSEQVQIIRSTSIEGLHKEFQTLE
jgi:hypothetical protein